MTLSVPKGVLKKRNMCTKLDIYVSRQLNLESDFFRIGMFLLRTLIVLLDNVLLQHL